jgi:predicted alpha-1,6-mannanase (GH76 family)
MIISHLALRASQSTVVSPSSRGANRLGIAPRATVAIGLLLAALTMLPMPANARGKAASDEHAQTQAAADALQQWYVGDTGLYRTTGWWNSANVLTTLANLSRVSHSTAYLPVFANTLSAAQAGPGGAAGFLNKYYDDEGWWALAWIDVYDLSGKPEYLRMADSIFSDMQLGWDDPVCGGGVWWNKDKKGKNAIENELFLAVAAALANRETDAAKRQGDLAWAHKEWTWFLNSDMINADHLVNDGLNRRDPAHCKNNGANTWTYNQGVILGALVELNKADPDPALPRMANAIAEAAIKHLTDAHGILLESARGQKGGDGPQFKGIFARNLMELNSAFPRRKYRKFLIANARSVLANDRDAANHLGFWWAGPFDRADAARQSSALDVLVGAWAVQ